MRVIVARNIVISASLTLILLACSLAAWPKGRWRPRPSRASRSASASITFNLPAEMLPEPLGLEGVGVSEKSGRVLLSGPAHPGPGKRPQGVPRRRQPA